MGEFLEPDFVGVHFGVVFVAVGEAVVHVVFVVVNHPISVGVVVDWPFAVELFFFGEFNLFFLVFFIFFFFLVFVFNCF